MLGPKCVHYSEVLLYYTFCLFVCVIKLICQVGLVAFNIIAEPLTPDRYVLPKGVPIGVLDLLQKSATNVRT